MKINILISIILTLWFAYSLNVLGQSGGIWDFNEASETTVNDTLGSNNTGTLRSGVTFQSTNPSPTGGSYLNFTGSNSAYVVVNDHSELDITTDLTLEAYIKTAYGTGYTQGIF